MTWTRLGCPLGAKLGAIRCGPAWAAVDSCGPECLPFRPLWTRVDGCGRGLEIYGSEGWGFESLRACCGNACGAGVSTCSRPLDLLTFRSHSVRFVPRRRSAAPLVLVAGDSSGFIAG